MDSCRTAVGGVDERRLRWSVGGEVMVDRHGLPRHNKPHGPRFLNRTRRQPIENCDNGHIGPCRKGITCVSRETRRLLFILLQANGPHSCVCSDLDDTHKLRAQLCCSICVNYTVTKFLIDRLYGVLSMIRDVLFTLALRNLPAIKRSGTPDIKKNTNAYHPLPNLSPPSLAAPGLANTASTSLSTS